FRWKRDYRVKYLCTPLDHTGNLELLKDYVRHAYVRPRRREHKGREGKEVARRRGERWRMWYSGRTNESTQCVRANSARARAHQQNLQRCAAQARAGAAGIGGTGKGRGRADGGAIHVPGARAQTHHCACPLCVPPLLVRRAHTSSPILPFPTTSASQRTTSVDAKLGDVGASTRSRRPSRRTHPPRNRLQRRHHFIFVRPAFALGTGRARARERRVRGRSRSRDGGEGV
ncbi:hypothetical protein B0H16DRAFT_1847853, partial [Mycena metata]